jgi:hypothetical protein
MTGGGGDDKSTRNTFPLLYGPGLPHGSGPWVVGYDVTLLLVEKKLKHEGTRGAGEKA